MAKTLYHSELAKAGRVLVKITSEVTPSKFTGKPPFLSMVFNGEARNYTIESEACAAVLRGRNGQTLLLEASGSGKDNTAQIQLFAAPIGAQVPTAAPQQQAPPANQPPPAQAAQPWTQAHESTRPPPQAPPPQEPPQESAPQPPDYVGQVIETRAFLARRGNALRMAADEALRVVEAYSLAHGLPFDDQQKKVAALAISEQLTQTTFTTLFLCADRAGMTDTMPSSPLEPFIEAAKKRLGKA